MATELHGGLDRDAALERARLGLGDAAVKNVGLIAGTVAPGDAVGGPPALHASSHENGGGDEISVAGLSGLLATAQTPAAHTHVLADVTDAGDAAAVDFPGGTTDFLRADGTFATPPASSFQFPVGAIYMTVDPTNPATVFGYGTWVSFGAGRVLIGVDTGDTDFDTVEETGGAKTVASSGTVSAPTFTGSALGTHSHGAGTYATSAHTGTAVADHASHTHTYTEVPNHVHVQTLPSTQAGNFASGTRDASSGGTGGTPGTIADALSTANPTGGVATGTTAGPSVTLTHSVTQPDAHTMSGSSEAVSAGTPAGTNSTPTYTGDATSVVQPYITCYFFKRTA